MLGRESPEKSIELQLEQLYKEFTPVAKRFGYAFRRPAVTVGGRPSILLLGNHSSGKSSIINNLLGDPPVQNTGVAPTDDGFTVLMYGKTEADFTGPAALGQLPKEFSSLAALGPHFLSHLAVKVRDREFLKTLNLIDSPGMIDAPEHSNARLYDFSAAARAFVDAADLVLFLFDPDKPGTTSESVEVLSTCLHGSEFKLRVLLNKADTLDSVDDYARVYGTLCWNLGRVLRTKDMPQIFALFTPSPDRRFAARIPVDSFERQRGVLLEQLHHAGQRRMDAVLAAARNDFTRLLVQVSVLLAARRRGVGAFLTQSALFICSLGVAGLLFWWLLTQRLDGFLLWLCVLLCTAAAGTVAAFWCRFRYRRMIRRMPKQIDTLFAARFANRLSAHGGGDLQPAWEEVRDDCVRHLERRQPVPLFCVGCTSRLQRLLDTVLPNLSTRLRP